MVSSESGEKRRHKVVLLHGLAAHWVCMSRLAWGLRLRGYSVDNFGYRSIRPRIGHHAKSLSRRLAKLDADERFDQVHIVAHSMGSIITRAALVDEQPNKLSRCVMLGPPNRGSDVARSLAPKLGWLCPALVELSDDHNSFVSQLPSSPGIEFAVIAAARDHVVPVANTHLPDQRDWLLLPGRHGELPWRSETLRQVAFFLERGRFEASTATPQHLS